MRFARSEGNVSFTHKEVSFEFECFFCLFCFMRQKKKKKKGVTFVSNKPKLCRKKVSVQVRHNLPVMHGAQG